MAEYYDRYKNFRVNGHIEIVPFLKIAKRSSDIYIRFDKENMRLDTLSYKYYGDANFGWLILQANPEYGSMEFSIEDGVTLRIPYPLSDACNRYEESLYEYDREND